jgi:site-specific recombinase XerD
MGCTMVGHYGRHLYVKRGVFYYNRRIPKKLQKRYQSKRIVLCLHTKLKDQALITANRISLHLESVWNHAHLELMGFGALPAPFSMIHTTYPSSETLKTAHTQPEPSQSSASLKLSDALQIYLRLKGGGRSKLFFTHAKRNMSLAIDCLGDLEITSIRRSEAVKFRDFLIRKELSTESIRRVLATIRASFNITSSEYGLNTQNPFSNTYVPKVGVRNQRLPMPDHHILEVQRQCMIEDDAKRWLVALLSDTGMRLAEALGLIIHDVHLDEKLPYIDLVPHKWRPLKTPSSQRKIPLVGASLWAAKRAVQNAQGTFLFSLYANKTGCRANSASATLNKFLKKTISSDYVLHSFRHAMRDRLRAVECPSDIQDAIGGWQTNGIGHGYGKGYPLEIRHKWLEKIALIHQPTH